MCILYFISVTFRIVPTKTHLALRDIYFVWPREVNRFIYYLRQRGYVFTCLSVNKISQKSQNRCPRNSV